MAILLSFGGYLARPGVWPDFPFDPPVFAEVLSAFVFGAVGFFLPDLIVIATKSGFRSLVDMLAVRVSASVVKNLPKRKARKKQKAKFDGDEVLLDTSALIDSRLIGVVNSGFLRGKLIISKNVLTELRHLADSKDEGKRVKARRALDDLTKIKKHSRSVKIKIVDRFGNKETDGGLVEFALKNKLPLLTLDFNLSKEAQVRGVEVLSFNTLANSIKMDAIPGQELEVKIVQSGSEKGQGVGFLFDGAMVVVDKGDRYIGKTVKVGVVKAIQRDSGRIIFGTIV